MSEIKDSGESWYEGSSSIDGESVGLANCCPARVVGGSTSAPVCFLNKFSKLLILSNSSALELFPVFAGVSSRDDL